MKELVILGATGTIGAKAVKLANAAPERFHIDGLVAGRRSAELAALAESCHCKWLAGLNPDELRRLAPSGCRVLENPTAAIPELVKPSVDMILCAISGTSSLPAVLAAAEAGKDLALATKEILVMAGDIVTQVIRRSGTRLLPVDSEHCAVFQCLQGRERKDIKRIILTASGGPFFRHPEIDLSTVTPEQALAHPTWKMGPKITIDSATMMNKALEIIEAAWLFGVTPEQIDVVVHPQSIVHSMVEFNDKSVIAQLAVPDMGMPILYCLDYPEHFPNDYPSLDLTAAGHLDFFAPDHRRFPGLNLAKQALKLGGTAGAILNAANEAAVERFCRAEIRFDQINLAVAEALEKIDCANPSRELSVVMEADRRAREFVNQWRA